MVLFVACYTYLKEYEEVFASSNEFSIYLLSYCMAKVEVGSWRG